METLIILSILLVLLIAAFFSGASVGARFFSKTIYKAIVSTLEESNITKQERIEILDKLADKIMDYTPKK